MTNSIWTDQLLPRFEPLSGSGKTDVLIIGGGIAGLLCAHTLRESGIDCLLLEADTICSGITKDTTAKITSQHGLIYHRLARKNPDAAQAYLRVNEDALAAYKRMCRDIPCGFEERPSYVYTTARPEAIEEELIALQEWKFPAEYALKLPLPFSTKGAVKFPNQAQFHPLSFLAHIANGLNIHEHTPVRQLTKDSAITDSGELRFDSLIIATHFPFLNKHGMYFLKLYQHRSYVLALQDAQDVKGMYIGDTETSLSLRNYGNQLLLGGGGHRTGKNGGGWRELTQFANTHYPHAIITRRWAAQDCMSLDGMPYIGPYSRYTPNVYVASGFQKWGMTWAMASACMLRDRLLGIDHPYASFFSPQRSILTPQLGKNALETVWDLITPSKKRCPHMGCALKWNRQERTWDCPCHGSRFSQEGKLIDNPATGDLKQ